MADVDIGFKIFLIKIVLFFLSSDDCELLDKTGFWLYYFISYHSNQMIPEYELIFLVHSPKFFCNVIENSFTIRYFMCPIEQVEERKRESEKWQKKELRVN